MVEFKHDENAHTLTCTFSGRMDLAASQEAGNAVVAKLDALLGSGGEPGGLSMVFDLAGVDFVASAFLRICIQTAKRVGPERFQVTRCNPAIKRIFAIAGMDSLMRVS